MKYFKIAANQGNAEAQSCYESCLLELGDDCSEAMEYINLAVDQGTSQVMSFLAAAKQSGDEQRISEAMRRLKLLADHGDATAQYAYAFSLLGSLNQNLSEVVRYCKMAADQGYEVAQMMYDRYQGLAMGE